MDRDIDGQSGLPWHHQKPEEVEVWDVDGATFLKAQGISTVSDTNWKIVGAKG